MLKSRARSARLPFLLVLLVWPGLDVVFQNSPSQAAIQGGGTSSTTGQIAKREQISMQASGELAVIRAIDLTPQQAPSVRRHR